MLKCDHEAQKPILSWRERSVQVKGVVELKTLPAFYRGEYYHAFSVS